MDLQHWMYGRDSIRSSLSASNNRGQQTNKVKVDKDFVFCTPPAIEVSKPSDLVSSDCVVFCTPPTIEVSKPLLDLQVNRNHFCTPPTIEVSKPALYLWRWGTLAFALLQQSRSANQKSLFRCGWFFCTPPTIEVSKPQSLLIARMNNFCTPPTIEVSKPPSRHGTPTSSFAHLQQSRSANQLYRSG